MPPKRKTTPKKPPKGRIQASWEGLDPHVSGCPIGEANWLRNELKILCSHMSARWDYDPASLKFQIDKYPERDMTPPDPIDTSWLDKAEGLN